MQRLTQRLFRFLMIAMIVLWLVGCRVLNPQVPDQDTKIISNLTGFLVIECTIDSKAKICKFDFSAGSRVHTITPDCEENYLEPSLSPDGEKIALIRGSTEEAKIWRVDTSGQNLKPLVEDEVTQAFPVWSPTGDSIAYRVLEDPYILPGTAFQAYRHSCLYVVTPDGTGKNRLTPHNGNVLSFDWAPDDGQIVMSARLEDLNQDGIIDRKDRTRLYIIDLANHEIRSVLNDVNPELSMHKPLWSPDGNHIAYIEGYGEVESYSDLVVTKADGNSEVARLEHSATSAYRWSPDGEKIAYVRYSDTVGRVGYVDVSVYDLSTQSETCLTDTSLYSVFGSYELNGISLDNPVWSPDGSYLAFVWRTESMDYIVVASADGSHLSRITGPGQYDLLIWGQ